MKIAVGADHAGYPLKDALRKVLEREGHEVLDLGTGSEESVDYPDFAASVARAVSDGTCAQGLLVCGTESRRNPPAIPKSRATRTASDIFTVCLSPRSYVPWRTAVTS